MAIKNFMVISGLAGWRRLIAKLEAGNCQEYELEAAVALLSEHHEQVAESALCFDDTSLAREVKKQHSDFNVLIYQSTYPPGEVLVDVLTHFSARPLASLI